MAFVPKHVLKANVKRRTKLERRLEREEDERIKVDKALSSVVPFFGDQSSVARRDVTPKLARFLNAFDTTGNQTFFVRESYVGGSFAQQASLNTYGAAFFTLGNLGNSASYAAIFDQYKIVAASVTFTVQNGPGYQANTASNIVLPRLWTCIDYDDANVPTSVNYVQQYSSCMLTPPGTGVTRLLQPHVALAAYSGTFTSYANMEDQWVDIASTAVQHYGIKWALEAGGVAQTILQLVNYEVTLWVKFRSTR
jgi:hypothetical protein